MVGRGGNQGKSWKLFLRKIGQNLLKLCTIWPLRGDMTGFPSSPGYAPDVSQAPQPSFTHLWLTTESIPVFYTRTFRDMEGCRLLLPIRSGILTSWTSAPIIWPFTTRWNIKSDHVWNCAIPETFNVWAWIKISDLYTFDPVDVRNHCRYRDKWEGTYKTGQPIAQCAMQTQADLPLTLSNARRSQVSFVSSLPMSRFAAGREEQGSVACWELSCVAAGLI